MNIFNKNKQFLLNKEIFEESFFKELLESSYENIEKVSLKNNKNYSLKILNSNNEKILLHSIYNPEIEAERLVDEYDIKTIGFLVILGFGLGFHVKEVLKRKNAQDIVIVIEKNKNVFRFFLENYDITTWTGFENIIFFIGDDFSKIFQGMRECSVQITANSIKIVRHIPSCKIDPIYYEKAIETIQELERWSIVNINALINKANEYASNIFKNMQRIFDTAFVQPLFGKFKNIPALIVGAGPSLNKNLHLISEVADKCLIICVDTAFKILIKNKIKPHIIVSIDFTKNNKRYFTGLKPEDFKDVFLFFDPEVYPEIPLEYKGPKFFMNLAGKRLCDWFSSIVSNIGNLDKGLSVSHTGFIIARELGCDPITLIGQDLAYSDNLSHAIGAAMTRIEKQDKAIAFEEKTVDIFGGETITTVPMLVFKKHFEELIYSFSKTVIDATEGGLFIQGTKLMSFKHAIIEYFNKRYDVLKILKDNNKCALLNKKNIHNNIVFIISKLNEFNNYCRKLYKITGEVKSLISSRRFKEASLLIDSWQEYINCLSNYENIFLLIQDVITKALVLKNKKETRINLMDLVKSASWDEISDFMENDYEFFSILLNGGEFFQKEFEKFKESL